MHKYQLQNVSERWIAGSFTQSFKEVFYRWKDGLLTKLQCRRKMQIFFKLVQQGQRNQRKGAVKKQQQHSQRSASHRTSKRSGWWVMYWELGLAAWFFHVKNRKQFGSWLLILQLICHLQHLHLTLYSMPEINQLQIYQKSLCFIRK